MGLRWGKEKTGQTELGGATGDDLSVGSLTHDQDRQSSAQSSCVTDLDGLILSLYPTYPTDSFRELSPVGPVSGQGATESPWPGSAALDGTRSLVGSQTAHENTVGSML